MPTTPVPDPSSKTLLPCSQPARMQGQRPAAQAFLPASTEPLYLEHASQGTLQGRGPTPRRPRLGQHCFLQDLNAKPTPLSPVSHVELSKKLSCT